LKIKQAIQGLFTAGTSEAYSNKRKGRQQTGIEAISLVKLMIMAVPIILQA
jgi:hypothetical protein